MSEYTCICSGSGLVQTNIWWIAWNFRRAPYKSATEYAVSPPCRWRQSDPVSLTANANHPFIVVHTIAVYSSLDPEIANSWNRMNYWQKSANERNKEESCRDEQPVQDSYERIKIVCTCILTYTHTYIHRTTYIYTQALSEGGIRAIWQGSRAFGGPKLSWI